MESFFNFKKIWSWTKYPAEFTTLISIILTFGIAYYFDIKNIYPNYIDILIGISIFLVIILGTVFYRVTKQDKQDEEQKELIAPLINLGDGEIRKNIVKKFDNYNIKNKEVRNIFVLINELLKEKCIRKKIQQIIPKYEFLSNNEVHKIDKDIENEIEAFIRICILDKLSKNIQYFDKYTEENMNYKYIDVVLETIKNFKNNNKYLYILDLNKTEREIFKDYLSLVLEPNFLKK